MSSQSSYDDGDDDDDDAADDSSHGSSDQSPPSRRPSRTPLTPRKRRRAGSMDASRVRKYYLEGKYNDAYRVLYNDDVRRAGARFDTDPDFHFYTKQIGASTWSAQEQSTLFAALARLGRDDIPGIASAVVTKSAPETCDYLLLLHDAATRQSDAKLTLRDIPAAIEIGGDCNEQLELAGDALAWYQEMFDASQEQDKYGEYWLISPAVAATIEAAFVGHGPRATSTPPPVNPNLPQRGGRVIAGACESCKKLKQRCDRHTPCSNCLRRKIEACVYKQRPINSQEEEDNDMHRGMDFDLHTNILDAIPEAQLLDPHTMLVLSKTLFMNRSPSIPSPWPHWSEYQSELSREPAMYRSAFNDFHTLVLSITKRLVQTAIIQATSRLRSQRRRIKHGLQPFVKKRDVLTAIDIVGMKRDGRERWKRVARRCAVRVYERIHRYETSRKLKKEIPWDEVERIMTPVDRLSGSVTTDIETSADDTTLFKSRAARSGTPLPIDQLALLTSDDGSETSDVENVVPHTDSESSIHNENDQAAIRTGLQLRDRDSFGRYMSVPPAAVSAESIAKVYTLEDFDAEASRQEEEALWQMLGSEPPNNKHEGTKQNQDIEAAIFGRNEKVTTDPDDWRKWTEYRAEWEEHNTQVPYAMFLKNQKSSQQAHAAYDGLQLRNHRSSSDDSDVERELNLVNGKSLHEAELRAHSTRAYAALQEKAFSRNETDLDLDDSTSPGDAEVDLATQSIEDDGQAHDHNHSLHADEMDWEA